MGFEAWEKGFGGVFLGGCFGVRRSVGFGMDGNRSGDEMKYMI